METIFDHNVTDEEVVELLGAPTSKEQFISWNLTQIEHYGCIYRLCLMRGDHVKAQEYFDIIPNTEWKFFTLGNHCSQ